MPLKSSDEYEMTELVLNDIQNTSISIAAFKRMFDVVEVQCDENPSIAIRSYNEAGEIFDEAVVYYNTEAERDLDFEKIRETKTSFQPASTTPKKFRRAR